MLSARSQELIKNALADNDAALELIAAIDAAEGMSPAADVAAVSQANANTQTSSYVQADVQSIADLANANKAAINAILVAVKASGQMS